MATTTMPIIPATPRTPYAARLNVDYPEQLDRLTTLFRLIWIIPIGIILSLVTATGNETAVTETGGQVASTGGGMLGGLWLAILLMIVFRLKYPRWWFDFARELTRFGAPIGAYFSLLTDRYPSAVDEQSVHHSKRSISNRIASPLNRVKTSW